MNKYILNLVIGLFLMSFIGATYAADPSVTISPLITNDNTPIIKGTLDLADADFVFLTVSVDKIEYTSETGIIIDGSTWFFKDDLINDSLIDGIYDIKATLDTSTSNSDVNADIDEIITYNTYSDLTTDELIVDTTEPIITLIGSNSLVMDLGTPYIELGATVEDNLDLSPSLVIDSSLVNVFTIGIYNITYTSIDFAGNDTSITRKINVADLTQASIKISSLITNNNKPVIKGTLDLADEDFVSLIVSVDGIEYTSETGIVIDGSTWFFKEDLINPALVDGIYEIKATLNTQRTINSDVDEIVIPINNTYNDTTENELTIDTIAPVITLLGDAIINITVDNTYTDAGATGKDGDVDLTSSIVIKNLVNTANPGTYTITYNLTDVAGNAATQVTREVIVNEIPRSGGGRRLTPIVPVVPIINVVPAVTTNPEIVNPPEETTTNDNTENTQREENTNPTTTITENQENNLAQTDNTISPTTGFFTLSSRNQPGLLALSGIAIVMLAAGCFSILKKRRLKHK